MHKICYNFDIYLYRWCNSLQKRLFSQYWFSFALIQSLSHVQLFVTPWTAACQASLSFTVFQSLLKSMSTEWMTPCNKHTSVIPFSSHLQSFPASGSFPMSWLLATSGQNIEASESVLPMNIQGWFPLRLPGLIFQYKGLSRVFFSTTAQKHQFFSAQPSLYYSSHIQTWLLEKPYLRLYGPSVVMSLLF